jgi:hypothetical protein
MRATGLSRVMAGLDPAIHLLRLMDTRVKPAYAAAVPYLIQPVASADASSGWPLRRARAAIAS